MSLVSDSDIATTEVSIPPLRGADWRRDRRARSVTAARRCTGFAGVQQRFSPAPACSCSVISASRRNSKSRSAAVSGPLMIHVLRQFLLPGHRDSPGLQRDRKRQAHRLGRCRRYWHSDLSYVAELAPSGSSPCPRLPRAVIPRSPACTPPTKPYPMKWKRRIAGLRAVHSYRNSYDRMQGSSWRPPLTDAQKAGRSRCIRRAHPSRDRAQGAVRQ